MRGFRQFTAVVCAGLLACGTPPAISQAKAVAHTGARNDALSAAATKHGVPLELLMSVAMHQGRFELPPAADEVETEPAAPVEAVTPPALETEAMPEEAIDPEAPTALDPVVDLAPDETDVGLAPTLDADALADDPEAVADPVSEAAENQITGDAHADVEVFGMMYLTAEQTARAAQLTGASEEALRTDLATNIDGAAALLRAYADEANVDVTSVELDAWAPAVAMFVGADGDAEVSGLAMRELNDLYLDGFDLVTSDGERLELTGIGRDTGTSQQALTPGKYPPIQFIAASSSNFGSRQGGKVRFVVIHDMEGTLAGTIAVFRNPGRQASAHYNIRARDGHIVQMVSESSAAWHAGHAYFNHNSIGIEHEGFADRPAGGGFYTSTLYTASSQLTCAIAKKYGIPVDRKHIFGHGNVPSNLSSHVLCSDASSVAGRCGGASHHHDPGRFWNWTTYMRLVARCVSNKPTPPAPPKPPPAPAGTVVKGVIYKGTNTAAVLAGATVTLGTRTTTTNAEGYYQLAGIPAGTRTITASKAGYLSKSVTRAVSGKETWGSIGLSARPPAGTAQLIGVVTHGTSTRVAGAKVTLSDGRSTTTNADGVYKFTGLSPGTKTITVSKAGLGSAHVSRELVNGVQIWGSVKL
jgi:N-acetyl-anhydromuramyl-L-alanine amidase AmpD